MPNEFVARNGIIALNNTVVTGSVTATTGFTGSLFGTASWAQNFITGSVTSASYAFTASSAVSASFSINSVSSSYAFTASSAVSAYTASSAVNSTSALTASSADNFVVRQSLTASNALITGNITAQTLVVSTISSSITYSSGSNIFGNSTSNTQDFTGSVRITGSLSITGKATINDLTGSLFGTASWAQNVISSSYAYTASSAVSAFTASSAISSSYAITASYALNGGGSSGASFTLNQSTPSSTWTINHNLNNAYPVITVYDNNGFIIIPKSIQSSGVNQSIVTFSYAATGNATAVVQGTVVLTASFANNSVTSSFSLTASYVNPLVQNVLITGSLGVNGSITGSLLGTASLALTASSADNFVVRQSLTSSAALINGTLTATTLVVQVITSSTSWVTGSTQFGSVITNTHQFTGSILVSGSITGSRVNPRAVTTASAVIFTPNLNFGDVFTITSQSSNLTFANPLGTPVEGQRMVIRIKDSGSARGLTFSGSQYRASTDLAFPLSSSLGKTLYLGFIYNTADAKWDLLAKLDNF